MSDSVIIEDRHRGIQVWAADPAGNTTAVVTTFVPARERVETARLIMSDPARRIEQVGFEVPPLYGGDGRIEMMGGEFCGNAARSFGFLLCERAGVSSRRVEVSGWNEPLNVNCDVEHGRAFVEMPLPERYESLKTSGGDVFALVILPGIAHVIVDSGVEDEHSLIEECLSLAGKRFDALGILFCEPGYIKPVVYVSETGSIVEESSCGSGSLAAACNDARGREDGEHEYFFRQPGGVIHVNVVKEGHRIKSAVMGGALSVLESFAV